MNNLYIIKVHWLSILFIAVTICQKVVKWIGWDGKYAKKNRTVSNVLTRWRISDAFYKYINFKYVTEVIF